MKIEIVKVRDDEFVVQYDLHGWTGAQRCQDEDQARTYVAGFIDGFNAVKNVIGIGPHFDARVRNTSEKG